MIQEGVNDPTYAVSSVEIDESSMFPFVCSGEWNSTRSSESHSGSWSQPSDWSQQEEMLLLIKVNMTISLNSISFDFSLAVVRVCVFMH